MPRTETVTFHDADELLPHVRGLDGLGYVLAVRDGRLPPDPLMEAMGIFVVEAEAGHVTMRCTPTGLHLNLAGMVHGGMLSTLLDAATGFAVHTLLPTMATAPHVSVAYQFLRAGRPGVEIRATGTIVKRGRRLGHARGELHDADGRLLATGETTHAVVDVEGRDGLQSGPSA